MSDPGTQNDLPPILAASLALVVAGLAAVGATGDALTRAVRNFPFVVSGVVILALLAGLGLLLLRLPTKARSTQRAVRLERRMLWVLVLGVSLGIIAGAVSVSDREQPAIALQAAYDDKGRVTLSIEASAAGMVTSDQMTIQVIGLGVFSEVDQAKVDLCEQVFAYSATDGRGSTLQEYLNGAAKDPGPATLLLLDRLGPDSSGNLKTTIKPDFPVGTYQGVCAFSPLPSNQYESARNAASYLRLGHCPATMGVSSGDGSVGGATGEAGSAAESTSVDSSQARSAQSAPGQIPSSSTATTATSGQVSCTGSIVKSR